MSRFAALIFDLDDTLYPERSYVESGFRAIAEFLHEKRGLDPAPTFRGLTELLDAGVRGSIFDDYLTSQGIPPGELVPEMVQVYRTHRPRIELFAEARELLDNLARDHALGVVTDGLLEMQRLKADALGVDRWIDEIVFTDRWGKEAWKPEPKGLIHALAQADVEPADGVYIADNPAKDFTAARRAGMTGVRLRLESGFHFGAEPVDRDHAPDVEVRSFEELKDLLTGKEGR